MSDDTELSATLDELQRYGVKATKVSQGRKHQRVYFQHAGKDRFIVVALSGSDWRGPLNARQTVRHVLGVERKKQVGARRAKTIKKHITKAAEMPHITLGKDPFVGLREAYLRTLPAQRLWEMWFGQHLRNVGHAPINGAFR